MNNATAPATLTGATAFSIKAELLVPANIKETTPKTSNPQIPAAHLVFERFKRIVGNHKLAKAAAFASRTVWPCHCPAV